MTREKSLWKYLKEGMQGKWIASRHEEMSARGIPDISYGMNGVNGWIELKTISRWPARSNTLVRIRHLTQPQKLFIIRRGQMGGNCYILLRVGRREHLLFTWDSISMLGHLNKENTIAISKYYSKSGLDFEKLSSILGEKG